MGYYVAINYFGVTGVRFDELKVPEDTDYEFLKRFTALMLNSNKDDKTEDEKQIEQLISANLQ